MKNNIEFNTLYGILRNVNLYETYSNGNLKSCVLNKKIEILTSYGIFIPQYEDSGLRRKNSGSLTFYESGTLKSISFQEQTYLQTKLGLLPSEFVSFYETGEIKRILPLNGRLSAYWEEEDEENLATNINFSLECVNISNKIISILFYKNGSIKSITLWPKEKIPLLTPQSIFPARIGISLYESGKLKSFEPKYPVSIKTPIGRLLAYNNSATGLNGDINSLVFYEDGRIKSLLTISNLIEIYHNNKLIQRISPSLKTNYVDESSFEILPITIDFTEDTVIFNKNTSLELDKYSFLIRKCTQAAIASCSSCSSCNGNCN